MATPLNSAPAPTPAAPGVKSGPFVISAAQKAQLIREIQVLLAEFVKLKQQNAALNKDLEAKNLLLKQLCAHFQQQNKASTLESLRVELKEEQDKKNKAERRISALETSIRAAKIVEEHQISSASRKRHLSEDEANVNKRADNKVVKIEGQEESAFEE